MKNLFLDIETRSSVDLSRAGVYPYAESPDFGVLLLGYSIDGGPPTVVDIAHGERIPTEVLTALQDNNVKKWAYNAAFERICLSRWLGMTTGHYLDPDGWYDIMMEMAYRYSIVNLADAGEILQIGHKKLDEGEELVRFFSVPYVDPVTKKTCYHDPLDYPDKWAAFAQYNARDVEAEMDIHSCIVKNINVPGGFWDDYHLDQRINDVGVRLDLTLADCALTLDAEQKDESRRKIQEITGVDNANSRSQVRAWLATQNVSMNSLSSDSISTALQTYTSGPIATVLVEYARLSKTSTTKYQRMLDVVCSDGRARGTFMYYGASQTGRWSGRGIQLQNLPRTSIGNLDTVREVVRSGDIEAVRRLTLDVPDALTQLIRTALVPADGNVYLVADYSAIEARVLAWLAGERWRMEAFAKGDDIYCASASAMFHVPVEKDGANAHLRKKGKIAELALGYGGAEGALQAMGAAQYGLSDDELTLLVRQWRASNPAVVRLWHDVDQAARTAIRRKTTIFLCGGRIAIIYRGTYLAIRLPSGRELVYDHANLTEHGFASKITFMAYNHSPVGHCETTYGAKLVENIVQGIARDILAHAMQNLTSAGYTIVAHVHDEAIVEAPVGESEDQICDIMARIPEWGGGLILAAEGFVSLYYKKE